MLMDLTAALGGVLFHWAPANGYPDGRGYWATTNGLLFRWNSSPAWCEGEPEVGTSSLSHEFKILSEKTCLILQTLCVAHGPGSAYCLCWSC